MTSKEERRGGRRGGEESSILAGDGDGFAALIINDDARETHVVAVTPRTQELKCELFACWVACRIWR